MPVNTSTDFPYHDQDGGFAHAYLWPALQKILAVEAPPPRRIFEIGCGNGAMAGMLAGAGYEVAGIDPSESGIRMARAAHPQLLLEQGSAYDDLAARYGRFEVVLSIEVVEHLYSPRQFMHTFDDLLAPGGLGIVSTPYHGYLKNLAIALSGRFDFHFDSLAEGGHIKFWSPETLGRLLADAGMQASFWRVGRIPPLARSMIAIVRRR